jgi:hypothetical protein
MSATRWSVWRMRFVEAGTILAVGLFFWAIVFTIHNQNQQHENNVRLQALVDASCARGNDARANNANVNLALARVDSAQNALITGLVAAAIPPDAGTTAQQQAAVTAFYNQVNPLINNAAQSLGQFQTLTKDVLVVDCGATPKG